MKKYILEAKEIKMLVGEYDTYDEAKDVADSLTTKDYYTNIDITYEIKENMKNKENNKKYISLNQLEVLEKILRDNFYKDHFKIYDLSNLTGLKRMTEKQYKYLLFLFNQKQFFKIKKILDNFLIYNN